MARGQPELLIECDGEGCKAKEVVELRATAHGNYSDDHVSRELMLRGWFTDGNGRDLCCDCGMAELEAAVPAKKVR